MIFYKKIFERYCNNCKELDMISHFIQDINRAQQTVTASKQEFPLQTQITFVSRHPSNRSVSNTSRLFTNGQDHMIDHNEHDCNADGGSSSRRLYLGNLKQRMRHHSVKVSKLDQGFVLNLMNLERCLQENANRKVSLEAARTERSYEGKRSEQSLWTEKFYH
jgi:G3E family GTPase